MSLPRPFYQDSAVTIYHGDSREIIPDLPKGLVVTDPPYNVGYHYANYADKMERGNYEAMLCHVCGGRFVLIHYMEDLISLSFALEEIPAKVVAWVYPSNTARQWRGIGWWGCTPDFTKDGQDYKNPTDKRIAERISNGERARLYDWWEIDQVKNIGAEKTEHPCQIPLSVMARILKITDGELVIDPFCGSGTTLRAAKDAGRRAIGIELDERYCEIAARRMGQEVLDFTPDSAVV